MRNIHISLYSTSCTVTFSCTSSNPSLLAAAAAQACGHRYVKVIRGGEEQRRMVGKCYVRSNDLTYDQNDLWQTDSYEVCNPNSDMQFEGMCSMGISAGMTDNDVYIGSPGSFLWQGEH